MRRLLICATAIGLFLAAPALAAPGGEHQGGNQHAAGAQHQAAAGGMRQGAANRAMQQRAPVHAAQNTSVRAARQSMPARTAMGASRTRANSTSMRAATPANNFLARNRANTASHANTTRNANTASANSQRRGNRESRNASSASLRVNVQSSHQFHNGNYNAPRGYEARHWGYGDRLPSLYFASNYWIGDYLTFGLFAPPDGLVWVRVGDDALLIDQDTGEVVQADYGVFY